MVRAKIRRQLNNRQLKNRGLTLVELIITFMLLGVFMVVATMMIASTMDIYYQARGASYGLQVSNILNNKIAGELEGALNGDITSEEFVNELGQPANGAMLIGDSRIEFTNASGSHVNLGLIEQDGKQYLALHYYAVPSEDGVGNLYDAIDWTFDRDVYMGYSIQDISFSRPMGEYDYNVIQIDLTITSPKYGDYHTTEYVECYNFDDTVNPSRVTEAQEK
jgi:hypothetical protein